jgi:hypothetical protein
MEILQLILQNKKIRLVLGVLLLTVVIVWATVSWLSGTIKIKTNNSANLIVLYSLDDSGKPSEVSRGQGSVDFTGWGGHYQAVASNRISSAKQKIELKARQTTTYTINLSTKSLATVEPVLPFGVFGVAADKSQLLYVDTQSKRLYRLDASGLPVLLNPDVVFKKVSWANSSLGVGVGDNNQLYLIKDGVVGLLNTPFTYDGTSSADAAIASGGRVYISFGHTVYASNSQGDFKKFYTTTSDQPKLIAGKDHLAIVDKTDNKGSGEDAAGAPLLKVVDAAGRVSKKNGGAYEYTWSPDGKFLALSGDSGSPIYDSSLKQVGQLPSGNVNNITWLTNTTLLYGVNDSLWSYSTNSKTEEQIATMPLGGAVSGIYPSLDQSYVYVDSAKASGDYIFDRVGLTTLAKSVPDYINGLSVFFPTNNSDCTYSYTNFINPTIVMSPDINDQNCSNSLDPVLKQANLPISGFSRIYGNLQEAGD